MILEILEIMDSRLIRTETVVPLAQSLHAMFPVRVGGLAYSKPHNRRVSFHNQICQYLSRGITKRACHLKGIWDRSTTLYESNLLS